MYKVCCSICAGNHTDFYIPFHFDSILPAPVQKFDRDDEERAYKAQMQVKNLVFNNL